MRVAGYWVTESLGRWVAGLQGCWRRCLPSNPATRQPSNSTTQQLGNPATRQPSNSTTQQLGNPATRQPSNSTTQQPSNSTTQQLNYDARRKTNLGANMAIKKVGVLGCGLMGSGIAQIAAQAGYETIVREVEQKYLDKGFAGI